jgi:protein-tyrosine-phosphatase
MPVDLLIAPARRLRDAPDRLLHPVRRHAARRALLARGRPRTVLVVCHGNICRSPFAAGLLAHVLEPRGTLVASAGFVGPGRAPPAEAGVAAARRGVDLHNHRSQLVTPVLAREADLIVVMEPGQQRRICERFGRSPKVVIVLGDLDPRPIETRAMRDPVDQPLEAFEESYARIERCVHELVAVLRRAA